MTKGTGYSINGGLFILLVSVFGSAQSAELREQKYDRSSEYSRLDIDRGGFVSVEEYNGTRQLFEAMDSDGDGKLRPDEAKYLITFVDIPSGSFTMGSEGEELSVTPIRDAGPEHTVSIDGFRMATTEVTTAQYVQYLNSALQAEQITVERANSGPGRIVYTLPIWTIYGAPGTQYEGQIYASISPVSGLSHVRADGHCLTSAPMGQI
jgi:formylglycine-generating enzyme required for sulfatase activity